MEILVFVLGLLLLTVAPLVGFAAVGQLGRRVARRRFLTHEWDGLDAWAGRVGLTPADPNPETHWRGHVDLGAARGDVFIEGSALEVWRKRPAPFSLRVALSERVPRHVSVRLDARVVLPWRPPGLHRRFVPLGDEASELALLNRPLCEALSAALDAPGTSWDSVELSASVLKFVSADMSELVTTSGEARARELLALARAVVARVPERFDEPALLVARASDPGEPGEVRWRAGRHLFSKHWDSDALAGFVEVPAARDLCCRMMLAVWGGPHDVALRPEERLDLLMRARVVLYVQQEADDALVAHAAWGALMDPRLPRELRLRAARRAYTAPDTPGDLHLIDDGLVGLLLRPDSGTPRDDALLDELMTGGWRPAERGVTELARHGSPRVKRALVAQLQRLGPLPSDAAALTALADDGVPGADALIASLRQGAPLGMLSLSRDDTTRGALTASRGQGGLSPADD
jgi:hypothetical protein